MSRPNKRNRALARGEVVPPPPPPPVPAAQPPLGNLAKLLMGGTGAGLYLTFASWAYGAAVGNDMLTCYIALAFAWVSGCTALALSEYMGAFPTSKRWLINLVFGAVLGSVTVGIGIYFYSRSPAAMNPPTHIVKDALYASQLQELKEIDQFIGDKDEMELRDTFDFPNMIHFNTLFSARSFGAKLSPDDEKALDAYNADAKGVVSLRYTGAHITPKKTLFLDEVSGLIFAINVSNKHLKAVAQLKRFEQSAQLPSDVKAALVEFDGALDRDVALVFDVLNAQKAQDIRNLTENGNDKSYFYGATTNDYAFKFIKLRPKADKLTAAIRNYLDVQ